MFYAPRRHVFMDLRPYVCTFPNCQRSDYLFESTHEWFEHERMLHRREWFCGACQEILPSSRAFEHHLLASHGGQIESVQLPALVRRSERAAESKQDCTLCGQVNLAPRILQRHIGRHMQQIALFVIPNSEKEEGEDGEDEDEDEDEDEGEEGLEGEGANVNAEPAGGKRTALQRASAGGHLEVVDRLLEKGADVNAEPARVKGRTALQGASEAGHLEVVNRLIEKGANVNADPRVQGMRQVRLSEKSAVHYLRHKCVH